MNMSVQTPPGTDATSANEQLRCTVEDSREIGILLYELCKRAEPLSLHREGSQCFHPSSVLAVDADSGQLVLDGCTDPNAADELVCGRPVQVHAQLDRVDISFVLPQVLHTSHQGRDCLSAAFPDQVLHLQRRELYRLPTPLSQWPTCDVPAGLHGDVGLALRVADIGSGGMALLHRLPEDLLAIGQRLHGCRLQLPDGPTLMVDIRVCNERQITRLDGEALRRTGVAFEQLPASAQNHISRYIFSVDRQRSARRQRT